MMETSHKTALDPDQSPKKGVWKRLTRDHKYRGRLIHSVSIFWAFLGMGWCHGITGPTFPDLRQITNQDLDTGSWIYTSGSIGYLLGSLLGGVLYSRLNRLVLIGVGIAMAGVSMAAKPWCEWFPLMVVVGAAGSLSSGVIDMGGNAEMVSIWEGEEGSMYMQALHFFFSFGGIISPLLAKPFLAPVTCQPIAPVNHTEDLMNGGMITTLDYNTTEAPAHCIHVYGETKIHIPYLISGILMSSGCVPFLIMYLRSDRSKQSAHDTERTDPDKRPVKLPIKLKLLLMFLLSSFMMFYCAVEDGFIGFLMTFCLQHLNWSKDYGSYASSSHWAAFSFGRFTGIFLARRFSSTSLLFTYLIFIIVSFVGLLIGSLTLSDTLPWIFIPLAGFSMSVVFPCVFTLTETRIMKVTGLIASMLMISSATSGMVNPLVFGYLMDHKSPLWFVYLLLGESSVCLLLFAAIYIIVRVWVRHSGEPVLHITDEQELTFLSRISKPDDN